MYQEKTALVLYAEKQIECTNFNTSEMNIYMAVCFIGHCFKTCFSNKPWFLRVCSTSLLETLWGKEKLLVTSNFSFLPQCFFYPFIQLFVIFIESKLSSANYFSLEESNICRFGKGETASHI